MRLGSIVARRHINNATEGQPLSVGIYRAEIPTFLSHLRWDKEMNIFLRVSANKFFGVFFGCFFGVFVLFGGCFCSFWVFVLFFAR